MTDEENILLANEDIDTPPTEDSIPTPPEEDITDPPKLEDENSAPQLWLSIKDEVNNAPERIAPKTYLDSIFTSAGVSFKSIYETEIEGIQDQLNNIPAFTFDRANNTLYVYNVAEGRPVHANDSK